MKYLVCFCVIVLSLKNIHAKAPAKYMELLPYVQASPDQGEVNTCLFMASTGAMELLLNKKNKIKNPKANAKFDLAESFLIWQNDFYDRDYPAHHFIESPVKKFNHGEAIHNLKWPFVGYFKDGTDNWDVWNIHPEFSMLPRLVVPQVKTELLFARGKKWATNVLYPEDIELMKEILSTRRAPLIVNYNDDSFWHVVLIVGYDDTSKAKCYQTEVKDCNVKGNFYVRDSNGNKYEERAYNWFLTNGNAAAVVELK